MQLTRGLACARTLAGGMIVIREWSEMRPYADQLSENSERVSLLLSGFCASISQLRT